MTANATACATLVDEWIRCGVRHAVIAPGSRSTPLAIALASRPELAVHVVHDERVAAFIAMGLGIDCVPALLVCTSGTAAVNFHPAVVEADLSEVPMIIATADRPPELRGIGSAQTIDQLHLYGTSVRWFHDAVVPDEADPKHWRPLAQRVFAMASNGPVHLNLPFREPLIGEVGELPEPIAAFEVGPFERTVGEPLSSRFDRPRGVIIAGGLHGLDARHAEAMALRLGWPMLADPSSGLRAVHGAVTAFDGLLRCPELAESKRPEVVVRFGRMPASKVLAEWVVASAAPVIQVGGPGVVDPERNVLATASLDDLASFDGSNSPSWLEGWCSANDRAEAAIDEFLLDDPMSEPGIARAVAGAMESGTELFVASSMPVRDLEWYGGKSASALSNRGANGIDGTLSTALGRALGGRPVVALIGDIAFIHDSNALWALAERNADLRIIVIDNAGGGIFSLLPAAKALPTERFEQLFGTPHATDIVGLAHAHGLAASTVSSRVELLAAVTTPGPSVTRVVTNRAENVLTHGRLNDAIIAAVKRS